MIYLYAFLFPALICGISQLLMDRFKLTSGIVTSLLTIIGAVLSFLNVYDYLIYKCGAGATILIMNFGHLLYSSALKGYYNSGLIGIFSNFYSESSLALSSTLIISFIFVLIFRPKD